MKVIRNFGGENTLYPKKLDMFFQNASQLHRNLTWGVRVATLMVDKILTQE